MKGRGTPDNPANRYERIHLEPEPDLAEDLPDSVPTTYYRDASRTILAENDSPDLGFRFSINPYRGCEHGCIYCYARPSHEYLGFSAGLDFETRLLIKEDAPALLRRELSRRNWEPQLISMSGNTDPYQPVERRLRLARGCLEVFRDFLNPVGIVTKSDLVTRDIDLLAELAAHDATRVFLSVTSLDPDMASRLEPRAARPERRLRAIETLAAADIPVGVLLAPVIPGLNDSEIPSILSEAAAVGARTASWILVRLPAPVDRLFEEWLGEHFPDRASKVLARIRDTRGGEISDSRFGTRMRGEGTYARQLADLFKTAARRHGLDRRLPTASAKSFRRGGGAQGALF